VSTNSVITPAQSRRALFWSLAAGLMSAALAGWLLQRYAQDVSGGERLLVLRAQAPIERGSLLTDELLVEASVPASYVEARAVRASDRAKIRGVRTATALDTQDTLLWTDLAGSQQQRDLSALVQAGNRALTVTALLPEGEALIRPGDYVDVLANLGAADSGCSDKNSKLVSVLLLQRVLVLAVGSITDPQVMRAEGVTEQLMERERTRLTLSLKVEEAQLLTLAQERGRLAVMLRQPDDTRILDGAPELPVSSLFDSAFRNELQRRRSLERRPVRLTATAVVP
jgi:pilus assembly protein CpaB